MVAVGVERRESLTVTQKSAYWVMPPAVRSVAYAPIKEIEFIGKKRKAVHSQSVADEESTGTSSTTRQKKLTIPSEEEQKQFFRSLATSVSSKPVVLSVVSEFVDNYVPTSLSSDLPQVLTDLYTIPFTYLLATMNYCNSQTR